MRRRVLIAGFVGKGPRGKGRDWGRGREGQRVNRVTASGCYWVSFDWRGFAWRKGYTEYGLRQCAQRRILGCSLIAPACIFMLAGAIFLELT
jgi:hypothetical protein